MADRKLSYSTVTTLTITSFHSLATSATAGWQSAAIDNSTTKYLDILVKASVAAVNTAPANSKAFVFWVAPLLDSAGSDYDSTGDGVPSGTQGTITIPDFTSLALPISRLGRVNYPTQNKVITKTFSVLNALGFMPVKFSIVAANHSGFTTAASGNAITWQGVFETVT